MAVYNNLPAGGSTADENVTAQFTQSTTFTFFKAIKRGRQVTLMFQGDNGSGTIAQRKICEVPAGLRPASGEPYTGAGIGSSSSPATVANSNDGSEVYMYGSNIHWFKGCITWFIAE